MVPPDYPRHFAGTLRPTSVRELARSWLSGSTIGSQRVNPAASTLRIVTYNVHGCVGLDGRLSPARIARVLASLDADIIALQELDVGRRRSGGVDQAAVIAGILEMQSHFGAALESTGERYGNAILSRWPMRLRRVGRFAATRSGAEPRAAVWATVNVSGEELEIVCTHLGLSPPERLQQVQELLGSDWPCQPGGAERVVLCGDFNAAAESAPLRLLSRELKNSQGRGHPVPRRPGPHPDRSGALITSSSVRP